MKGGTTDASYVRAAASLEDRALAFALAWTAEAAVGTRRLPDLGISGFVLDPDGRANKTEGFADLVFQEALMEKWSLTARLVKRTNVGGATDAWAMYRIFTSWRMGTEARSESTCSMKRFISEVVTR